MVRIQINESFEDDICRPNEDDFAIIKVIVNCVEKWFIKNSADYNPPVAVKLTVKNALADINPISLLTRITSRSMHQLSCTFLLEVS